MNGRAAVFTVSATLLVAAACELRCERVVWSPDGRVVLFVMASNQGTRRGVVAFRPKAEARTFETGSVSLEGVASTAALTVDSYRGVSVPLADLRADFPLWIPPDAQGDVGLSFDGGADLKLDWRAHTSREAVSLALVEHFKAAGWTERSHELLNPTTSTSFTEGWRIPNGGAIPLGRTVPPILSHRWTGEWTRDSGELVRYTLDDIEGHMRGYAYWLTPALAREHERMGKAPK